MFVQLMTGFVSDWFWLTYLIPISAAFYYLWIKVLYPWSTRLGAQTRLNSSKSHHQLSLLLTTLGFGPPTPAASSLLRCCWPSRATIDTRLRSQQAR